MEAMVPGANRVQERPSGKAARCWSDQPDVVLRVPERWSHAAGCQSNHPSVSAPGLPGIHSLLGQQKALIPRQNT